MEDYAIEIFQRIEVQQWQFMNPLYLTDELIGTNKRNKEYDFHNQNKEENMNWVPRRYKITQLDELLLTGFVMKTF